MKNDLTNHLVNAETAILTALDKRKYNAHNMSVALQEIQYAIRKLRKEKTQYDKSRKEDTEAADKAFNCAHLTGGYCSVIHHEIENGYASLNHCKNCEKYEKKDKYD
jgi:hypothetical protein